MELSTLFMTLYFIVAILFNCASLFFEQKHGVSWTTSNPKMCIFALFSSAGFAVLSLHLNFDTLFQFVFGALMPAFLFSKGIFKHLLFPYRKSSQVGIALPAATASECPTWKFFHPHMWLIWVIVNVFGVFIFVLSGQSAIEVLNICQLALFGVTSVLLSTSNFKKLKEELENRDRSWYPQPHIPGKHVVRDPSKPTHSLYLKMRDSVQIAVDVYLPHDAETKEVSEGRFPTFINLTRYNRRSKCSFPLSLLLGENLNLRTLKYVNSFVPRGYAVVACDVRGTGASFGHKDFDLCPDEAGDFGEILQWVKQQNWSNGKTAAGGISYDAITALELVSAAGKGGVDALCWLFSPLDFYEDLLFPGGIACTGFSDDYTLFTTALERNKNPQKTLHIQNIPILFRYVNGVSSVADYGSGQPYKIAKTSFWGKRTRCSPISPIPIELALEKQESQSLVKTNCSPDVLLEHAVASHTKSWLLADEVRRVNFKDDVVATGLETSVKNANNVQKQLQGLKQSGTKLYLSGGYYDSASVRSAAKIYQSINTQGNRFLIGPWTHGCRMACSPFYAHGYSVKFNIYDDIGDFLDFHLKGEEPPVGYDLSFAVHFYMQGAEGEETPWRAAACWPPETSPCVFYLGENGKLVSDCSHGEESSSLYQLSLDSSSGFVSRWNLLQHLFMQPVVYSKHKGAEKDQKCCFTSERFVAPLSIVGSVTANFVIDFGINSDPYLFCYLEDVNPETKELFYVSETQIRVNHRETLVKGRLQRTFERKDFQPKHGKQYISLSFEPVAYQFKTGHQLRVRLTGSDTNNFWLQGKGCESPVRIFHNSGHTSQSTSFVELPVYKA